MKTKIFFTDVFQETANESISWRLLKLSKHLQCSTVHIPKKSRIMFHFQLAITRPKFAAETTESNLQ